MVVWHFGGIDGDRKLTGPLWVEFRHSELREADFCFSLSEIVDLEVIESLHGVEVHTRLIFLISFFLEVFLLEFD